MASNWWLTLAARAFGLAAISWTVLLSADQQSVVDADRQSSHANQLVTAGKPEQAIPIYKHLAEAFPNESSFRINLVIALFKAGHYRQTVEECNALVKRQPDLFPAWLFLGASDLKLGEASNAEEPLRKAVAIQGNDTNARIMLADALLANEHWAEAASQYEVSAQAMPDSPRVWFGLNRVYEPLAGQSLKRVEKLAPRSAAFLALSAELALDSAQIAPAFQYFRRAINLQPSFPGIHARVAEIYDMTGHPDWAEAERAKDSRDQLCVGNSLECQFAAGHLRDVSSAEADTPAAIYWQARAFLALSRQAYGRLQELPPSRERYEATAVTDEKRGLYPEAAAAWKEALRFEPTDRELKRHLALALCHANDCVSALPILTAQLAQEPASVELNYLCGLALNSTRTPALALPYLENAVRLDGAFLPARAALGEAYLEAGKSEQAIPHLRAVIADDESGIRHYQLARAYQAAGMRDQSLSILRDYREILRRRSAEQLIEPAITPP